MTEVIPINLAVEDSLSEAVLRKMLESTCRKYAIGPCYSQAGSGYLRRTIKGFNNAARGTPFLVLADLDRAVCPPTLMAEWLPVPKHHNLIFRIAVREVEAWLLADGDAISDFLGVSRRLVPVSPETLPDPKQTLLRLAARSRSRELRADIVPPPGSRREQGPNYNGRLIAFVERCWDPTSAALAANSLQRAMSLIRTFNPLHHPGVTFS